MQKEIVTQYSMEEFTCISYLLCVSVGSDPAGLDQLHHNTGDNMDWVYRWKFTPCCGHHCHSVDLRFLFQFHWQYTIHHCHGKSKHLSIPTVFFKTVHFNIQLFKYAVHFKGFKFRNSGVKYFDSLITLWRKLCCPSCILLIHRSYQYSEDVTTVLWCAAT